MHFFLEISVPITSSADKNPPDTGKCLTEQDIKSHADGIWQDCRECAEMTDVKGFLIDLDGVMYIGDQAIQGAREAIDLLRDRNYRFRFVSNTTRKSRNTIAEQLSAMGFCIPVEYIFTPPLAAVSYLRQAKKNHCYLLTTGDVHQDFEHVCACDTGCQVDFVIIGDAGDKITYDNLNTAFRHLMNGADLIALEKDRVLDGSGRSFSLCGSLCSGP